MERVLFGLLLAFGVAFMLSPIVLRVATRLKAGQVILHYVSEHKEKEGTPTMGGVIFIFGSVVASFLLFRHAYILGVVAGLVMIGYGAIGFLDDYIKIVLKRNLGLRAYQKLIAQVSIAFAIAIFAYTSEFIGSTVYIPFVWTSIDLGLVYIPLVVIVYLAITNGVNLTDGLDGLAGNVSFVYFLAFSIIIYLNARLNVDALKTAELMNLSLFSATMAGGVLAFLVLNSYKAKIFMGDTGSLALGSAVGSVAVFSGQVLLVPVIGVMFVASCVSVILQVIYFKRTKGKRIFLMAPLHHHYQMKGKHEAKIVMGYFVITLLVAVTVIIFTIRGL
ncbi:MAG: phospho-N-acetylmuramoyl-pentapeptide-transferase [Firmicutes bacterium]|nr:phospho-N-acetylmuramoyl-pentapeptide-transferase [Bacillota bacterium]